MPEEFERRFWASRAEALLQTVKADPDKYQAQVQKVDSLDKPMALTGNLILMMGVATAGVTLSSTRGC